MDRPEKIKENIKRGGSFTHNLFGESQGWPNVSFVRVLETICKSLSDKDAVVSREGKLTYVELDRLSRIWAERLLCAGIGKGDRVLVCMNRSCELIAILLGVLRSGACYVPVDPGFPADRIAAIIEDSYACAAITNGHTRELLPTDLTIPVLLSDADPGALTGRSFPEWYPEDLAYLIFTSGSTGRPKGVPVTRGAFMNLLIAMVHQPGIAPKDRVLALTTISFDMSVPELFAPLIVGATIYIAEREDSIDPERLCDFITQNNLTFLQATPASWRLLFDYGWRPDATQKLLCGAEAVPRDLVEGLFATAGQVWHMYGPTEATVWSSCHRVTDKDVLTGKLPLGNPFPNLEYMICNDEGTPCAIGVPGELWISGIGVTPGYYCRPDLNEGKFARINQSGEPRLFYRTGDLVCERSDSSMIYIDRLDNQIKIRGFRIEPGEIETILRTVEGVQDAVVIARGASSEDSVLVGCILPEDAPEDSVLFKKMSAALPDYMVPRIWIRMNSFPETPNRKIDRKQIRETLTTASQIESLQAPGLSENLAELAVLWERILGCRPTAPDDSFLTMGGHSLAAARLSLMVRREFQCWVEPHMFIAHPMLSDHFGLIQTLLSQHSSDPEVFSDPRLAPEIPELIPVSSTQNSMWFAGELQQTHSIYNESEAFFVEGHCDAKLLSSSLDALQSRHVAFRLVPVLSGRNLIGWRTKAVACIPLQVVDWTKEDIDISEVLSSEARAEFDFDSSEPLIRFTLHRLASGDHIIQFTAHHTVIDGLSALQLWRELSSIYGAYESGASIEKDAGQDRVFLNFLLNPSVSSETDLAYWSAIFRSPPRYLDLKTDFPRPAKSSLKSSQTELKLGTAFYTRLKESAASMGLTPFQLMLAVYFIFLDRYSQQSEYVVGVPFSGRQSGISEEAIGLFINTVPIRVSVSPFEPFSQFAARVQRTAVVASAHEKLPLHELVDYVNPPREVGRTPLFQTLFSLNDQSELPETLGVNRPWHPVICDTGYAPTELVLFADLTADSFNLRLHGSKDLFRRQTLVRMLEHYRNLINSACENPNGEIHSLDMMDQAEKKWLDIINATYRPYPREGSIVSCFQREVAENSDKVAIEFGDQYWTYSELASQAARIGKLLNEHGVKNGDSVGVVASKHPNTVAALLGILWVGAAYVPLDMTFPRQRLEKMLGQSNSKVILAHNVEKAESLQLTSEYAVLAIKDGRGANANTNRQSHVVGPLDAAYIMFTSGTTGDPKGIEVCHRNVLRLVKNTNFMRLDNETRFLMNSPLSFDASTLEIWGPLLNGGTLIIPEAERLDNAEMQRILTSKAVNSIFFTTTLFHYFSDEADAIFGPLRYLVTGGEVLSPRHCEKVLARHPGLQLINGYGPTENTTFSCCYPMFDPEDVRSPVPIGKPIANSQVYILDHQGHDCPIGVPGEIHTGGDGVALGYVNQQTLTENSFLNEDTVGRGRVYRTGDLGCWREDGNIEFLGRIDNQVKIRGFRIEPEEITLKVLASGRADHAFTVTTKAPSGELQLTCYFVPSAGLETDAADFIRKFLAASLPAYMVPTHLIPVPGMPIGPTGKIDKSQLPKATPARVSPDSVEADVFRDDTERKLAEIWKEVLGRSDFGRHDDFFQLGGSSLKALNVFSRIEKRFDLNVPLAVLLQRSTISALAKELESLQPSGGGPINEQARNAKWDSLVELGEKQSKVSPIICIHAVGGNVLSYRGLFHLPKAKRPVIGFQSRSLNGMREPHSSLESMASDYVEELLAAGYSAPFTILGGSMGGNVALEMAHRLNDLGLTVDWVILLDTIGPKARHLTDNLPKKSFIDRSLQSINARTLFYFKDLLVRLYRLTGYAVPYRLRSFWIEEAHKRALNQHVDKPYDGQVLLIRAPEQKGPVYCVPMLGWRGYLTGKVVTEYVDVKHEVFMESDIVHRILQNFLINNDNRKSIRGGA